MGCIFQFAGFQVFPKATPESMETALEPQSLCDGYCFDLRKNGLSQIVFDEQARLASDNFGYADHFLQALAGTQSCQRGAVDQSKFSAFGDGLDVGDALRPCVERRDVIEPFEAMRRAKVVAHAPIID